MITTVRPRKWVMAAYLLPSFILFVVVVLVPVFFAIRYSFFDWPGGARMTFIGMANYIEMIKDPFFWNSFYNNVYITVVCLVIQIGFAFVIACLLQAKCAKLKGFHRVVAYFPVTIAAIVVGFVWSMIYDFNYGILNFFLELFGRADLVRPWLADSSTIMMVVSIPLAWQYIGMYLIIILAAMTSINTEVLEMAEIDGARAIHKAIYIIMPLIKNTLIICVMLCISGNMRAFDHIYAMTRGGPGFDSSVMALYSYRISFMNMRMGYGSALSIGILILSLVLVVGSRLLLQRLTRKGDV